MCLLKHIAQFPSGSYFPDTVYVDVFVHPGTSWPDQNQLYIQDCPKNCFRVTNHSFNVYFFAKTHKKIIRFNISMNEVLRVNVLHSTDLNVNLVIHYNTKQSINVQLGPLATAQFSKRISLNRS